MAYYVHSGECYNGYSLINNQMLVYSSGRAVLTTLNFGGSMLVYSGGVANRTTVNSGGGLHISGANAVADTATVMSGGILRVYSGATANSVTVSNGGELTIPGGWVNNAVVSSGGSMNVISNGMAYETVVSNGEMYVLKSGGMIGGAVRGGHVEVFSGGMAMLATVSSGGEMVVGKGGSANFIIVSNGGEMIVDSRGVASGAYISSGGGINVLDGTAYSTTVSRGGFMAVHGSGAVAHSTTVQKDGSMWVFENGRASSTIVSSGGILDIFARGSANSTTVSKDGAMLVSSGGKVFNTVVSSGGYLYVSSGGTANSTTVNYWGYMRVSSGGTANSTTVNGGGMNVYGTANSTTVSGGGMYVSSGGVANSTTVTEGDGIWTGNLYVSDGGRAVSTYISSGYAFVFADGTVSSTVMDGGVLSLGGIASDTVAVKGGSITLEAGAKHTGRLSITADTVVVAEAHSIIDFDISTLSTDAAARLNNWSRIEGTPDYTVTVSASQDYGVYKLAQSAAGFDRTITVNTAAGKTLGTLSVGGRFNSGDRSYALGLKSGTLSLTVDSAAVDVLKTVAGKFTGAGGVFQYLPDGGGKVRTASSATTLTGSLDPAKWELAAVGDFNGNGKDGLLWVEKGTGYAYMQYDMTTFAEVNNKTNCLGVVGEGYSIKASGDFSKSGIDGVLMQGPAFGDPDISLNYGLPVWARDNTGATYNGWLGALVNTWEPGDQLKGDLSDPASINANNYKYDIVGVGDFDGDGRDDVMLQNTMPKVVKQGGQDYAITGSGDVFVFLTGNEAAIKAGAPPTVCYAGCATDGWSVVGFGDFDRDGVDDALLTNGVGIAGWKMANGQRQDNFWFGDLPSGYEISGVADVDNDGTDDLILADAYGFSAWKVVNGNVTGAVALK